MSGALRLEVLDFEGPTAWRWRLTDEGGAFVADAAVRLADDAWELEAFSDLGGYVRRNAAPDQPGESEAEIVAAVGAWIGASVWDGVGRALVERAPVTVRVEVPAGAEVLAYRPLELGWVDGRPLAAQDVSLVIDLVGGAQRASTPVADRLRMLAVFSLPVDASALNLRRERVELARLIQRIAATNSKAVELRVIQYGVTRARLEEVLLEEEGWDVIHISGHGLPAGLLLERADGQHDLISSADLVQLLAPAARQLKLVSLSSCESAALTAAEHLRLLGITPTSISGPGGNSARSDPPLPAVATVLARELDCAVLAMRYPVEDEFAIALAQRLYDLVLGKGQPLARALTLTLPRVLADQQLARASAMSIATPALFGGRAVDLRLRLPDGAPAVFDREQEKLASFPPQPERFVGRVGALSTATAALAPESRHSGVLFHGMAGAGKTACALELAYTHEQSFPRLVWHQAPKESEDLAPALSRLAFDFENQLEGVQMLHLVDNVEELRRFLPRLAAFLKRTRVLIVLDNCESLLTPAGDWRDERWRMVVEALSGHGGLSRLVMTSRILPRTPPAGIRVEAIHALSIHEAVLLAREWPHLRTLLDGTAPGLTRAAARELAVRSLAMVQGHPKLIELADGEAAEPSVLRKRLEDADQVWLGAGVQPGEFLTRGEPTAAAEDYLRVLETWTRATVDGLPEPSRLLFGVLCCIEPDDRLGMVLNGNWEDIWTRLQRPGDAPELEATLRPLDEHALVDAERTADGDVGEIRVHPAVAASGRADAGPDLQAAVDLELAAYWDTIRRDALEHEREQLGWLVVRAARSGLPYFVRQQLWPMLMSNAAAVLSRDLSPTTAASLLPLLRQGAAAARGGEYELALRRLSVVPVETLRPLEAAHEYRELLAAADEQQDYPLAGVIAGDLVRACRKSGHLQEALALCDTMREYDSRAGLGPWTLMADRAQRLQVLAEMGHSQVVLDEVLAVRDEMAELPERSERRETADPFNVRETIFDIGRSAAQGLKQWEDALALNAEQLQSLQGRDAQPLDVANTMFNDYAALLQLGRIDDAQALLLGCREIFEQEQEIRMLAGTLSALADVESRRRHYDQAVRLESDALRIRYAVLDVVGIRVSHFNLSNYLMRHRSDRGEAVAHRLAAAIVDYQTDSGGLEMTLIQLAVTLAPMSPAELPDWEQVCELVGRIDGVRFADLVAQLPTRAADGPAALEAVLARAQNLRPEEYLERYLDYWSPVVSGMVAAAGGDARAAELVEEVLGEREALPDWAALVKVLRDLIAGERRLERVEALDGIDVGVARYALDALEGRATVDEDAWHLMEERPLPQPLVALIAVVLAAVDGDQGARETLLQTLAELAGTDEWAALAAVLQRILDGERSPALLDGLDRTDTRVVEDVLANLAV